MGTEARGQHATGPRQSWGPGVEALQEAPHGRSPYPKLDGSHFLPEIDAKQAQQHRARHAPQIPFPDRSSVGFAPCPDPGFLSGGSTWKGAGLDTQGRAPKPSRRVCLPRSQRTSKSKGPARGVPGVGKPQHPFLHPRPQLLCICLFTLEKAPRPRQEMGQFQQAELGNKEPHCVPCPSSPPWASHRSLGTGGSMGA